MHMARVAGHGPTNLEVRPRDGSGALERDRRPSGRSSSLVGRSASSCTTGPISQPSSGRTAGSRPLGRPHTSSGRFQTPTPEYNFAKVPVVTKPRPLLAPASTEDEDDDGRHEPFASEDADEIVAQRWNTTGLNPEAPMHTCPHPSYFPPDDVARACTVRVLRSHLSHHLWVRHLIAIGACGHARPR